ncbi:hypothetical protein B0A50_06733 [Salinomyces thailandicus]|uniref:Uncharacterized protein n=1 Tax=Salinomyces thailandicus TaxID=706561 RepID=A0A4U0TQL9_9PEZI|nr:hypothetical protein B0A50_06733 [Salinomyces thailandica]
MAASGIYDEDYEISDHESDLADHGSNYADHESAFAESPADGYFSQREHPQETFVEQPSTTHAESEAKAREATQGSQGSTALFHGIVQAMLPASPPSRSPISASRSPVWADESTPLFDAGPAPPDYATATASTRGSEQTPSGRSSGERVSAGESQFRAASYGSMGSGGPPPVSAAGGQEQHEQMQWPFGNRGNPFASGDFPFGARGNPFTANGFPFDPNGNPNIAPGHQQSMRDTPRRDGSPHSETSDEESGLLRRRRRRRGKRTKPLWRRLGSLCRPAILLNLILAALIVGLVLLIAHLTRDTSNIAPGDSNDPFRSNATVPRHPTNRKCAFNFFTESISFGFDEIENFTFNELMQPSSNMPGGITGNIWILPAPPEQEASVRVWISFATTDPWHVTDASYAFEKDSLTLHFPGLREPPKSYGRNACMDVGIGIYVKDGVDVDRWAISSANLNVVAEAGLFGSEEVGRRSLRADTTTITTVKGNVNMAYWTSRQTIIKLTSGSLHGIYALRDLLSVSTRSGAIGIQVDPQEADPVRPAPAEFSATSSSGSIHVGFPINDFLDRNYTTHVDTHSSSISGTYLLGESTSLRTHSGSIQADILPFSAAANHSVLQTDNASGPTELTILPPYIDPGSPITHMESQHNSNSGSMALVYPQEWEGTIEGRTTSGNIALKGRDVQKYTFGDYFEHRVVATKGRGSSRLGFSSKSGSVTLRVGDY